MFPAGEVQISANVMETQQNLPALQGAYLSVSTHHIFSHDKEWRTVTRPKRPCRPQSSAHGPCMGLEHGVHLCVHSMADVHQGALFPHLEDVVQKSIQWRNWARFKESLCLYTRNNSELFIPAYMLNIVCALIPVHVVS